MCYTWPKSVRTIMRHNRKKPKRCHELSSTQTPATTLLLRYAANASRVCKLQAHLQKKRKKRRKRKEKRGEIYAHVARRGLLSDSPTWRKQAAAMTSTRKQPAGKQCSVSNACVCVFGTIWASASITCAGTGIVYLRARDHFSLCRGRLFRQRSSSQNARSKTCTHG